MNDYHVTIHADEDVPDQVCDSIMEGVKLTLDQLCEIGRDPRDFDIGGSMVDPNNRPWTWIVEFTDRLCQHGHPVLILHITGRASFPARLH